MRLASAPSRHSASICSRLGICMAAPRKTASNTFFQECWGNCRPSGRAPTRSEKPNTLSRYASNRCRIKLSRFLLFEKPLQVDAADRRGSRIKASAHLNSFAHLVGQLGRNVDSSWLAIDKHGNLELGMKGLAVGAMTAWAAAGAFALDKRARQHLAKRAQMAQEVAAQFQVGFADRLHMTLIIVSDKDKVNPPAKICKNDANRTRPRKHQKQTNKRPADSLP